MADDSEKRASNGVQRRWEAFSDRHLFEDTIARHSGRWAPRLYRIPVVVPSLLFGVALVAWTVFVLLARLSGFHVVWWWPKFGSVPAANRGDLVRDTLGVVALFGATLAAIYAYRKQRVEEAAGYRLDAEGVSKRYQEAAEQLGHATAAVRLAGAYAMARLADEWSEERQTCVDVLCAYLRMKPRGVQVAVENNLAQREAVPDDGDFQVRQTIARIICSRVAGDEGEAPWARCDLDLSGAVLVDFRLTNAHLSGLVILNDATLSGTCLSVEAPPSARA